jgi:hypothetical protein
MTTKDDDLESCGDTEVPEADAEALQLSSLIERIARERDRARRRASEFRAQNEPTHAFGCDSIAVVLSAILADAESAKALQSASVAVNQSRETVTTPSLPPSSPLALQAVPGDSWAGVELIARERQRQIAVEGWTPEHDDSQEGAELLQAAVWYLDNGAEYDFGLSVPPWPWERSAWKPSDDRVDQLAKAGALIAAEIDRIQRRDTPTGGSDEPHTSPETEVAGTTERAEASHEIAPLVPAVPEVDPRGRVVTCPRRCSVTTDRNVCAAESGLSITVCCCDCHAVSSSSPVTAETLIKRLRANAELLEQAYPNLVEEAADALASLTHERQEAETQHKATLIGYEQEADRLTAEALALRQQLAERDAQIDRLLARVAGAEHCYRETADRLDTLQAEQCRFFNAREDESIAEAATRRFMEVSKTTRATAIAHTIDQVLQIVRKRHIPGHSVVTPVLHTIEQEVAALRPQTGETTNEKDKG